MKSNKLAIYSFLIFCEANSIQLLKWMSVFFKPELKYLFLGSGVYTLETWNISILKLELK